MPRGPRHYVQIIRTRSTRTMALLALAVLAAAISMGTPTISTRRRSAQVVTASATQASKRAVDIVAARRRDDFAAMQAFRPGYPFWQHVFTLPDHSIAFGSTVDGRLLATFPTKGEWTREAVWADPALAHVL